MATLVVGGLLGRGLVTGGLGVSGIAAPVLTFPEALYAELAAIGDLTDFVGDEIYPQVIPQGGTLPAVSYQEISNVRDRHHGGRSGTARARYTLKCVSGSYAEAHSIAVVLAEHFDPTDGLYAGPLGESIEVLESFVDGEKDLYEPPKEGSDAGRHTAALDLIIRYREPGI